MKTLKNQTLLYDDDCPLCSVYTKGFITAGMLDKNGKKPYCQLSEEEKNFIDVKRAANEIALVDYENKTVLYGIDSLLKVIGHSFPWMEKVGRFLPIYFLLKKLYYFISYNRKVIIPSKKKTNTVLDCIPDFNVKYRTIYIVFGILISLFTLNKLIQTIPNLPKIGLGIKLTFIIGQFFFQGLFLLNKDKKTLLNYFGNLITVSLLGVLVLLPLFVLYYFIPLPAIILYTWFGGTVLIMMLEHFKRIKLLELDKFLNFSWLFYVIIVCVLLLI